MAYLETSEATARALVGKRVEIPVHYDLWMRGARCGKVVGLAWEIGSDGSRNVKAVRVAMDHPQVKRQVRVWRIDLDYIRVLD